MSNQAQTTLPETVLRIEGEMTIYKAAELKETLLQSLKQYNDIEIDLSNITEFDASGLQLLVMAKKYTQQHGKVLRLVKHSPAVVEVFELLNTASYFGDPLVIPFRDNERAAACTSVNK